MSKNSSFICPKWASSFLFPVSVNRITFPPLVKIKLSKCGVSFSFVPPISSSFNELLTCTLLFSYTQTFIALKQMDYHLLPYLISCPLSTQYTWTVSFWKCFFICPCSHSKIFLTLPSLCDPWLAWEDGSVLRAPEQRGDLLQQNPGSWEFFRKRERENEFLHLGVI